MDLTARVDPADGGTSGLVGNTEASVGGKAAAFGGRMMDAVSDQILKQFAANFTARVAALAPAAPAVADSTPSMADAPAGAAKTAPVPPNLPPPAPAAQLNGLALLWAIFRDWLRGLFSKKAS
jgi:hypothetical protein